MLHQLKNLRHINSVVHEGKVVLLATDGTGDIHYTIKQDGFEDSYLKADPGLRSGWERWQKLEFPNEMPDASVEELEKKAFTDQNDPDRYVLRSLYQTQEISAVAPVQAISALGHIYVFRQSTENKLLVDRFILDGLTNKLNRKYEVRFKRSRQKHKPIDSMKKQGGSLANIDTLDFRDANNEFFYEPTTELSIVDNLYKGWFSVVLVPTFEHDVNRWHIFAYNAALGKVELTTIRASAEGLFDPKDYSIFEEINDVPEPRSIPGIIKRVFNLEPIATNGLAATKYDLQQEQATQDGKMQLVKTATRLMLAIPTNEGTAVLSFAIAADGTLAQINESGPDEIIRSNRREVLLPLNTLDEIKTFGDLSDTPQGEISTLLRGKEDIDAEDQVVILTNAEELADFDVVEITHNRDFQGHYQAEKIDENTFAIQGAGNYGLGYWKKQEEETGGYFSQGMIDQFQTREDNKLIVTCPGHGLENGDTVNITGTKSYNGSYPIKKVDDSAFVIDRKWGGGEAVNITRLSDKRRGLVFDGAEDFVQISTGQSLKFDPATNFTIEFWIKTSSSKTNTNFFDTFVLNKGMFFNQLDHEGLIYGTFYLFSGENQRAVWFGSINDGQWQHLAITADWEKDLLISYQNGLEVFRGSVQGIQDIETGLLNIGHNFDCQMADLRIWKGARSAVEIKNNMRLPLSGKENGLMGYWRLGAIAEGKVLDFSVNGNDGVVHGDPYASAVSLERKLINYRDNTEVPAVMYANEELFAVSERATYIERFEFKVNRADGVTLDYLNDADGRGSPIFKPSLWGKANRRAEEKKKISAANFQFNGPFGDWFEAQVAFKVPDGAGMLRSFEIAEIAGDWDSLEIRKHRVTLLSDTITKNTTNDSMTLPTVSADQADFDSQMQQFAALEMNQAIRLREKLKLEKDLARLRDPNLPNKIREKQAEIAAAQSDLSELEKLYKIWAEESAYSRLKVSFHWDQNYGGHMAESGLGYWPDIGARWYNWNQEVTSVKVPYGLKVYMWEGHNAAGRGIELTTDNPNIGHTHSFNDAMSSFQVLTRRGNTSAAGIRSEFDKVDRQRLQKSKDLENLRRELKDLQNALNSDQNAIDIILARLGVIKTELNTLDQHLRYSNRQILSSFSRMANDPQEMFEIGNVNELLTTGALLESVNPAGPLKAIETCEGFVQLSYFDKQGRMRLTNYDATADQNNKDFEQWLPEKQRVCLDISHSGGMVTFDPKPDLPKEWTIEAWFFYPLADTRLGEEEWEWWNTLIDGENGSPVVVKNSMSKEQLGMIQIDDQGRPLFYDSGCDLMSLSSGWHHLTAVAREDSTLFFIDGRKIGDTKAVALESAQKRLNNDPNDATAKEDLKKIRSKSTLLSTGGGMHTLGNQKGGGRPFGKLAEVRIWETALTDLEITVNCKTLLSGNEPGLLAYYPLSEGQGNVIRDKVPQGEDLEENNTILAERWWGCTAPLGNMGSNVLTFDGFNDYVQIADSPSLHFGTDGNFSIEMWVKTNHKTDWANILSSRENNAGPTKGFQLGHGNGRCAFYMQGDKAATGYLEFGAIEDDMWHHLAVTVDRQWWMIGYKDGQWVGQVSVRNAGDIDSGLGLKIAQDWAIEMGHHGFRGQIADIRIWKTVLTAADIEAARFNRLTGQEADLAAYFPFNELEFDGTTRKIVDLTGNNAGFVHEAILENSNSLPLGSTALVANEYSTIIIDPMTAKKSAVMRRFFAYPTANGVELLPDKRIEALELQWIGNAQFEPTLLGFIEGAPPVPSENLTVEEDYNGATSVELTQTDDVTFSWNRAQDSGLGATVEIYHGLDVEAEAGVLISKRVAKLRSGFKGSIDYSYQFQNESSISSSSSLSMTDKLELRGTPENVAKFPHLGTRFIPKNIGYALVVSALADVFITRLVRSGKMVGYQVLPVPDIPPDVNTITFLMNPAYTMNGSLDGMTGSAATSRRFFKQVPEMRAQFGSLYPASYYRLQEAYDLKRRIEEEDKRRESYFANFQAGLLDETSLSREIDSGAAVGSMDVERQENKADTKMSKEEKDKAEEQELARSKSDAASRMEETSAATEQKQAEIQEKINDQDTRVHATDSFAGWQKRMEDIQIRAGKRNIVNTYVWDADGGLRTEAQSFANTVEHTIGGSFTLNANLGYEGKFAGSVAATELTAQATVNLTQTMSKTESRSRGFELNVDLSGLEYKGITNYDDKPLMPGEKVDRYRFMTFFLEGSTNHFHDFFNYVVDPEWLASNDEEARALRQTQAGKPNKSWRVLHRVTYVERPALMGFGQDVRQIRKTAEKSDVELLQEKISGLEEKLDLILSQLSEQKG